MRIDNNYCGRLSWRTISIYSGVFTALLWAYHGATFFEYNKFPIGVIRDAFATDRYTAVPTVLTAVISSAISLLMIFGVIKKNTNCIFPWLAIHFTLLMHDILLCSYTLIICIFVEFSHHFDIILLRLLVTGAVAFSWVAVYLHCTNLMAAPTEVQLAEPDKVKILKASDK